MKVVLSSGHSKKVRGARGNPVPPQCDEVDEVRKLVESTADILRGMGVTVTTFHDDVSTSQSANLTWIVDHHNGAGPHDLDVSFHMNAFDHSAHGCEVLWTSSSGQKVAKVLVDKICAASGWTNRGAKERDDLKFLNSTNETAVLLELGFCDHTGDCNILRSKYNAICTAIAEGISGQSIGEPVPPVEDTDLPEPLDQATIDDICVIACDSDIAEYNWKDRGVAPLAYTQGMALAFAMACKRFDNDDPAAIEMAKANTGNDDLDALSWYNSNFQSLGMRNDVAGIDTLRHLYVLLLGLGMRESSGKHCEGTDASASGSTTRPSDEIEAGLHQTSWNIHTCHDQIDRLFAQYMPNENAPQCYLDIFEDGVSCSSSSWKSYGTGDGYDYQELSKICPVFHVEVTAIGLRNRRKHWGPLERREVELKVAADEMFKAVQDMVLGAPVEPEPPAEVPEVAIKIEVTGKVRVTINGQVYE